MGVVQEPRIVGRYELYDELASGGMATVYLGRSIGAAGFAKSVAIKRLHEQFARDPEFVSLLLEEARLSERIRHPNVVATLDVVASDQEFLLVMEYVHGETLARLLRDCAQDGRRCPPAVAARIAHDVLLGLHAAHNATDALGAPLCIVHRDVSPQNVIVGVDGIARLLDFGIAKAAGAATHTREGEVKGKVPYMAPEILKLQQASPQSDVYAVAVTLWESLCARRLFRADSPIGVWASVLESVVPTPSSIVGPLGVLDDVVMRGLSRSMSERYPTALAMAQAIEEAIRLAPATEVAAWVAERAATTLSERSAKIRAIERSSPRAMEVASGVGPPSIQPPPPSAATASGTQAPAPVPRARGWGWGALALVVVAVLGASVKWSMARRLPQVASPAPSSAVAGPASAEVSATAAALTPMPPPTGVGRSASPVENGRPGDPAKARKSSVVVSRGEPSPPPIPPSNGVDPCDPPFTIDEGGRKHFKVNCLK